MKNIDDVISGPDLTAKKDPIAEYYEGKREELRRVSDILSLAIDNKAPRRVVDAIRDWRDDIGNTGD